TLAGLRRLRFGGSERDAAGRALLAALSLLALAEQDARGYALRSRCDLVLDGAAPLQIVRADGSTRNLELDVSSARDLYAEAYAGAEAAGFQFRSLRLTPQDKLVQIVRQSREHALAGEGGNEDAAS
ncbi:MAG TPA: type I-U CRISPR-associated protein Cas7, partial [Thermoanaerobaculia bacterium]|nr:type I-U CRISPR-associated protein Cas7 [Thermoanaerobaculia bacterium]